MGRLFIPALKKITATIRQAATGDTPIPVQREDDEEGVSEGAVAYRLHRQRERNASKIKEKKRKVLADQNRPTTETFAQASDHGHNDAQCLWSGMKS
jgi:hypothetical protein